jgi:adenine-specific DNA-methyltransferase
MNYIGSKYSLLPFIERVFRQVADGDERVFCDLFAGTGAVGRRFKQLGLRVIANDLQYYAYALNKAYLEIDRPPRFVRLRRTYRSELKELGVVSAEPIAAALALVNQLDGVRGFIARNYGPAGGRLYYTADNAERADAIRRTIEDWRTEELISEQEYFYLLAALLEAIDAVANTASVYGAYLKRFKASALKELKLRPLALPFGGRRCRVYQEDANDLIGRIRCDLLYLDPPYNHRQYGANYHVLETIAIADRPQLRGVTGLREYVRSRYCRSRGAADALAELVDRVRARHILMSYNDEGVIEYGEMRRILGMRGRVKTFRQKYSRFKADNGRAYKRNETVEYLHYVRAK